MESQRKIRPITVEQKYLSPEQAARILGVSAQLTYRMSREGQIPGLRKIGKRYLIPRSWAEGT